MDCLGKLAVAPHEPTTREAEGTNVTEPRLPGERGYGAYWKRQVRTAGLAKLRGLPEGVGGRALLAVLTAFGDRIDNQTGEAWPSQQALAKDSGQGKRTVERALKAARRLGWLVEIAPPVPRIRGTTYRATVPRLAPAEQVDSSSVNGGGRRPQIATALPPRRQPRSDSSSAEGELVVSNGEETLNKNSQIKTLKKELRPLRGAQELSGTREGGGEGKGSLLRQSAADHDDPKAERPTLTPLLDLGERYYREGQYVNELVMADLRKYRPWVFSSPS